MWPCTVTGRRLRGTMAVQSACGDDGWPASLRIPSRVAALWQLAVPGTGDQRDAAAPVSDVRYAM